MLKLMRWAEVENETLGPLVERQFISGRQITLARFTLRKGGKVARHSHEQEQFAWVMQGALKFLLPGQEIVVRAGEVLCIPPQVPHEAEALEDTIDIDVFSPARTDWAAKEDAYLRR
jgi:quercetin dioxygenase-like cupin family protein